MTRQEIKRMMREDTTGYPRQAVVNGSGYWEELGDLIDELGNRQVTVLSKTTGGCCGGSIMVAFPDDLEEKYAEVLEDVGFLREAAFDYVD